MQKQRQCKRCGTCCKKGGPILHIEDLALLQEGVLSLHQLVTVRIGEQVFNPFENKVIEAKEELIKIAGKGGSWECIFYDAPSSSCTIHSRSPIECRLLKCWDIDDIKKITGKGCLDRFAILPGNDPLLGSIETHEKKCSFTKIHSLLQKLSTIRAETDQTETMQELTKIMQDDLLLRDEAVARFRLSLQQELFYFGRPLFQAVRHPLISITLQGSNVLIQMNNP